MKKRKRLTLTVFSNYLLTYVGIAVFFCALLGIFLFNFFVSGYGESVLKNEKQKAAIIINDLENQLDVMAQIAYSVGNEMAYSYEKLENNNYNEFLMLKEFVRYSNAGMFTEQYFLLYHNTPRVYSVWNRDAVAYEYSLYTDQVLKINRQMAEKLYQQLNAISRQTILPLGDGARLFCYPIQINSRFVSANLCFCVTIDELLERAQIVSGGLENGTIYYNDHVLYQWDLENDPEESGELYNILSNSGRFSISLRIDTSRYMSRLLSYRRVALFALMICAGILSAGVVAAHLHSKPIRKIKQRLNVNSEAENGGVRNNELNEISLRLNEIVIRDLEQKQQFNNQLYFLRAQTLQLLLCGEYNDAIKSVLDRMNIEVENGHVGVIVLRFDPTVSEAAKSDLMKRIEDLSMEALRLYCAIDQKTGDLNIIQYLPVVDEVNQNEALDMIRELLDTQEISASIGDGWIYRDPHKLAASYAEARDDLLNHNDGHFQIPTDETQRYFSRIIGAIRLGETEEAKRIFAAFETEYQGMLHSLMVQRYMLTELLNMLVNTAKEMQINIPHHQLSVVLTAQNCKIACDSIRDILDFIGGHVKVHDNNDEKLIHKVVDYVRNHYTENDLSLDLLAEEFHVSAGYLSRLFRTSLGIKYKDYVLQLKMDYARQCLRQGMSVTLTSKECGYANISHFIKAFKMFVGVTPSAYQKSETPDTLSQMPKIIEYLDNEDE